METASRVRSNVTYNLLAGLLALGLVAGAALLFLSTQGPARVAELHVGPAESVECAIGSGAPVCYRFDLVNSGSASAFVRCDVIPTGGTEAVFSANSKTTYEGADALDPGDGWHLIVQVQAGETDVVSTPTMGCRSIP